jgi:Flp pilus assembly pilin Flp
MTMMRKIQRMRKKGQTALEYAMVVGAISLVLLSAWNIVGDEVRGLITGAIKTDISKQLQKGNATVR